MSYKIFKKRLKKIFKSYDIYTNKFLLLLRKGVDPYKHMDDWEKFNETTLPEKEEFYGNLNMEEITDTCMEKGSVKILK